MKLRCIYVNEMSDDGRFILGKEYEVINSCTNKTIGKTYKLKDDYEEETVVPLNGRLWGFEIVEEFKMEKKVFKGWELIKMCEESKIENGTILQDLDGAYYTVFDGIVLDGEKGKFDSNYETTSSFFVRNSFRIMKKKYTFEEAFKAYEEGKEIESCESDLVYQKTILGDRDVYPKWYEIRGKWYIND